ncbi:hypothetical protein RM553_11820 [Zunongwangia sp. F363]|uniref:Uncharacterized protein n=1 Tax=Autumnicola tepida TaxID=3075595 RepID=A0ABU3CB04_9FLAO|nr:hypothetical protein [Zunongwangia sp. F363]MDT0643521.1 hypothetical protein [Zunongwangia sp. F363]
MSRRNLIIISKVIFFYSIFYIIMKLIAIFQGAWADANLILCLPFAALATWGGFCLKRNKFTWVYAIAGAILIGSIRYFEKDLMIFLHNQF